MEYQTGQLKYSFLCSMFQSNRRSVIANEVAARCFQTYVTFKRCGIIQKEFCATQKQCIYMYRSNSGIVSVKFTKSLISHVNFTNNNFVVKLTSFSPRQGSCHIHSGEMKFSCFFCELSTAASHQFFARTSDIRVYRPTCC